MMKKIENLLKTSYARITTSEEPNEKKWVFSSVHNRAFNYNSSALFEYVKKYHPEIQAFYVMEDPVERKKLQECFGKESIIDTSTMEGIRKVLECKVWFTSTAPPLYGMGFRKKYCIINEAVVTTSEELIPVMSRSFLVEQERVKVWGQPRNDKLFEKINVREQMQKIFQKEKLPEFDSLLLYAPTFRDDGETRLFPFEEFHGENRGRAVEQLQNFLEKNQCIMCIRMHLYEKEGYEWLKALDRPGSRIRFLNEDRIEDIMEVLAMFDLLITDYSSIYIDYLLLERPILFLPYDREAYLKTRGFNFDYDEVTPGPKPKSYAEFLNSIEGLLYNKMNYVENRKKIERKFNKIQKPCSEDICRMVKMMCIR